MTSSDWWRAVARSARWSAVVGACMVSWSVVLLAAFVGLDQRLAMAGALGRSLVALSLAFLADDVITVAAPAVPTSARTRFLARSALGVPAVVIGWLGVAVIESTVSSAPVTIDPLAAITLSCGALGLALAVTRRQCGPSAGAVGAASVAVIAAAAAVAPRSWSTLGPDRPVVAPVVAPLMLVSVWLATAEPSRG